MTIHPEAILSSFGAFYKHLVASGSALDTLNISDCNKNCQINHRRVPLNTKAPLFFPNSTVPVSVKATERPNKIKTKLYIGLTWKIRLLYTMQMMASSCHSTSTMTCLIIPPNKKKNVIFAGVVSPICRSS